MDIVASPLVTVVLNILATALVSKGILDAGSKDTFVQLINHAIAGIVTVVVAIYSIAKIIGLNKHKISVEGTVSTPVGTVKPDVSQNLSTPDTLAEQTV